MVAVPGIDRLRRWMREAVPDFNKHVLNPVMLQVAGSRYWYAARLEHVGRRSGKHYATPIVARRVTGGFAVPLPYGTDVDWLRNLRAAGHAELVVAGSRYVIDEPRVVTFEEVAPEFDRAVRRAYRLMGVVGPWLRVTDRTSTGPGVGPRVVRAT